MKLKLIINYYVKYFLLAAVWACGLVVSDLRLEAKGPRIKSGC